MRYHAGAWQRESHYNKLNHCFHSSRPRWECIYRCAGIYYWVVLVLRDLFTVMEESNIHFTNELAELLKLFDQLPEPLKLIIHVGTPKTGTTSLQTYLDKKQRKLRGKGILYPHNLEKSQNPTAQHSRFKV